MKHSRFSGTIFFQHLVFYSKKYFVLGFVSEINQLSVSLRSQKPPVNKSKIIINYREISVNNFGKVSQYEMDVFTITISQII